MIQTERNKEEFLKLISENKGIILKICNSYCQDKTDREDLAQEIIIQLWKSVKSFDPDFKFTTWMYRVALNVAISFYRKEEKWNNIIPLEENHLLLFESPYSTSQIEEDANILQKHISQLKDFDKALILLYFEDKNYKEIAEIIGISETNVATKLSRIKEKLKQSINKEKIT